MPNIIEIKKNIKENPRTFVYSVSPSKKIKMIIKTDGKKEAKDKLIKMINKKKVKTDGYFMLLKITSHTGTKWGQGGPIAVIIDLYYIYDNKLKNVNSPPALKFKKEGGVMTGAVWFTKLFLETHGWNYNYLDNIISRLVNGKSILEKLATIKYNVEFLH